VNRCLFASLLVFLAWTDAESAEIPVVNHSFETPAVSPGNFNVSAPPPGWFSFGTLHFSGSRSVGVVNPNSTQLYLDPVPLGSNIGVVFLGLTFSNLPTGLFQTLTTTLQARTAYTLTVAVGNMASDPNPPHNQFNFTGFPGYRVELLASNFVVAADHNTLLPGEGRFLTSTVYVVTSSSHTNLGMPLGIRLTNLDSAPGIEVNFDNVRLDATPLPDPEVTISGTDPGEVQVAFTEQLQSSPDLLAWTNVVPLPISPWTITPDESILFYRAAE
jgi:hapalindole H/12-epi-hapalindole U/12-epi-fischerindole U synthase